MQQYVPPAYKSPHRVMVLGAATRGWYDATEEQRLEHYLPRFRQMLASWEDMGAKLIASFDDDYFVTGEPASADFSIYLLYEVEDPGIVAAMIQQMREEVDGARLDRCFRFEARIGRALFLASDFT